MTPGQRSVESHPDLDTLADLDAGVLDGAEADRVAAHVAGCARCEQVMAALGGVRADLRALPAPPVPAAVAARLESTLAELGAAPDQTGPVAAVAAEAPARVVDLGAARERRWRRLKAMSSGVAAVLVLFAAGASVVSVVRSSGGGNDTSAAGGGGGAADQQTSAERGSAAAAAPQSTSRDLPSYTEKTLRAALPSIEASSPVGQVADAGASGPAGSLAAAGPRTACAESIPGRGGVLRAVRWISYEGEPAYVLVFVDDAGGRTAYVVGEGCGRSPGVPARVLDTVR